MNPKHHNPSQENRRARAPYNFVPLPEEVVTVYRKDIPDQDAYTDKTKTGYIECSLTTKSSLYTRCAMTPDFFREHGDTPFYELSDAQKNERAQFFHLEDERCPLIPGSSLRGMVRALVEIVGYGKMPWVTNDNKITYRAVAKDEPLDEPYKKVLGKNGSYVRAGYLVEKGDGWYIHPAKKPSDLNLQYRRSYLEIKENSIPKNVIPGLIRFNDENYKPQYHEVSFDAQIQSGKGGKFTKVTAIGSIADTGYNYHGVLVCSGNMLETSSNSQSPRTSHALVLEQNPGAELKISEQAIINYKAGLTPFQKEPPFDEQMGCLVNGRPIFYVPTGGEVLYFGHSPNFRIPAIISEDKRIASPMDFVPKDLRSESDIDLAEAIFGYVQNQERQLAHAGRVFFTDAKLDSARDGIWLRGNPITPKILASPKPTTFQHYLVQDTDEGHNPDHKEQLAHYATPSPDETVIRGHKMYWHHEDDVGIDKIRESDKGKIKDHRTQFTRIKPVKTGATFIFRIYLENLHDHELGALLWVLTLPGESGKNYYHKLGMGKPLGMGTVKIESKLYLSNRFNRYNLLFDGARWAESMSEDEELHHFIDDFEKYVLDRIPKERGAAERLNEVERIKTLLKMMEWPGPDTDLTEYITIESNEYRERPVLPDPLNTSPPSSNRKSK